MAPFDFVRLRLTTLRTNGWLQWRPSTTLHYAQDERMVAMAPFDFAPLRSGRTDGCNGALRLRSTTLRTNGWLQWRPSTTLHYAQDERMVAMASFDYAPLRSGRTDGCNGVLRLRSTTLRTNGWLQWRPSTSLRYAQDERMVAMASFDYAPLRSGRTDGCNGVLRLRSATLRTNGWLQWRPSTSFGYAQDERMVVTAVAALGPGW